MEEGEKVASRVKSISHAKQQEIWEKEHKRPFVLQQMDSHEPSSGVIPFFKFLKEKGDIKDLQGIEMGCGKGRNVIWLAKMGIPMVGFDFSPAAIKEAVRRAREAGVIKRTHFLVYDAVKPWPFRSNEFDFAIDCFATTDIETVKGRKFTVKEMTRVLKPRGYFLVYVMSTEDEFHKEMIRPSPAKEKNSFLHLTTGKFEKVFDRDELLTLYTALRLVREERIEKMATFFGKEYRCKHHWMIFQKN